MIKQIEIVVSYSGKISKPHYENIESFWSVKEIIECDVPFTDEERNARMLQIKNDLQKMFEADYFRIHSEDNSKEMPAEESEIKPAKVVNNECKKLREECYQILMGKAEHSDFSKIKSDLWIIMKSIGITADKLNEVETWTKTKEELCKQDSLRRETGI